MPAPQPLVTQAISLLSDASGAWSYAPEALAKLDGELAKLNDPKALAAALDDLLTFAAMLHVRENQPRAAASLLELVLAKVPLLGASAEAKRLSERADENRAALKEFGGKYFKPSGPKGGGLPL